MTERWRKKLEGIDSASPSDDVFQRAKQGPTRSDEALPGPRMSTRVVTIVVAFLVFALAISAFAIPALRMGNSPAGGGTPVLMPLWPTQDADQLDQLQSDATVGNADWALSPEFVAKRFAHDVMGWENPVVKPNVHSFCAFGAEPDSLTNPASPVACADLPVGGWSAPGGVPLEDPAAGPSSGTVKGLNTLSYEIYPCDTDACLSDLGPEIVQVYQPLGQGDGKIWTVLQAKSPRITLSVVPAQVVHNGSTVSAGFLTSDVPTLAYSSCGSTAASSAFHSPSGSDAKGIALDVSLSGWAICTDQEPGYVWAATAGTALGTETGEIGADPLQGQPPSPPGLLGLTAVPVTMVSASLPAETTPPQSPPLGLGGSPSLVAVAMTTYTDPYGWTIDVPSEWSTNVIHSPGSGTQGAQFVGDNISIQVSTQTAPDGSPPPGLTVPTVNDSQFPLQANDLLTNVEGGLGGTFNGDGLVFDVTVQSPYLPNPLPEPERSILMHMIGSISFQPWTVGEIRHDWVAIDTPTEDVSWITVEGGLYMLFKTPDGYKLYGSISCAGKPPTKTSSTADGSAVLHCPDGSSWQMDAAGGGGGSGDAVWNDPPPEWAVATAHDGTLIAWVLPGVFPEGTGGSTPAPG